MPADHTHTWTVSFAGNDGQDITHFIKKVQFKLHADSYANPVRSMFSLLFTLSISTIPMALGQEY